MKANEYKAYKGLRKESLRDNMTDIELALTNIGELTTRDIERNEHPIGFERLLMYITGINSIKDVTSYPRVHKGCDY